MRIDRLAPRGRASRRTPVLVAWVALLTCALSGAAAALTAAPAAAAGLPQNWPTYHRNAARTGVLAGLPRAGRLSVAWRRRLDGAVYGQPLIIGRTVVAATEHDSVYGLGRRTGRVLWRRHVGTPTPLADQPCGNIGPLGITGTPVYDPANGLVYAVAQTTRARHLVVGIRVRTGRVLVRRFIPAPDGHPAYDQQRGALTLERGRVYVAFGGHFGDCGPYRGSVVGVPASGRGRLVSYLVPTRRAGGIWSAGGPVIGRTGRIYVGVGNGAATGGRFDHSDSVTALSPRLRRTGIFAPSSWAADNANDLDLGSMTPALLGDGRMLAVGKRGVGYLLNARHLGGVGGQLAKGRVCAGAFGGAAVTGTRVYVPCFADGLTAVSTARGRVRVLWRGPRSAWGSPVVGGGRVWVLNFAGVLDELSPRTGHVRHRIRLGSALPDFASPSLSGRLVLVGTLHGVVAVRGA